MLGFLLTRLRRRACLPVRDFIKTMGELYRFAGEVYAKNLSTTNRPRYSGDPRFIFIHLADPHLMCIPSLHVMVVIRTYTCFRAILRALGEEEHLAPRIEEIRRGALAITEAILAVKQHSINCIPAAMYAMTCFDPSLFPPEEAMDFASRLFTDPGDWPAGEALREHLSALYHRFLGEASAARSWRDPLLAFLAARRQPPTPPVPAHKKEYVQSE
jgi:hypothetical protein